MAAERMEVAMADVDVAAREDVAFHRAIAQATQNELYLVLLDSIGDALLEIRRANFAAGSGQDTVAEHRHIVERIAAQDPAGARDAMQAHLDGVVRWRQRHSPGGLKT
jgi:GntR family transcriptional repressor for pyruvate dehydrogenase complex